MRFSRSGVFHPIKDVIQDINKGKIVVVVDDSDRENEGDLIVAAEKVSAEQIAFMMNEGKGLFVLLFPVLD